MRVIQRSGTMIAINGKDYMVWAEYKEAGPDDSVEFTLMDVPIHVFWSMREATASDYEVEKVQPSGEQIVTGGF